MAEANGWRTNFYYQQELRSSEMNGIFNSTLVPGVYNADISIEEAKSAVLFNISIAAGTTLVFSNRVCTKGNKYYRQFADFANLSKDSYYTIKSTAETDVTGMVDTIGIGVELPPRFFLVAVMPYGLVSNKEPIFRLAVPSESKDKPYLEEITTGEGSYVFYDGKSLADGDLESTTAYLILGEFIRTGKPVLTGSNAAIVFSDFQANYTFTRRGLEEYRYVYSTDKNTPALDFSYTASLNAIKVYWSTFMAKSILFKQSRDDQRDAYEEFLRKSEASSIRLAKDGEITGSGVVYDFIFATFQNTYQDKYELSTLMTDTSYSNLPSLYSCKWIQETADSTLANSRFTLSESITPQLELLDRITGKPVLSRVATAIKRGDTKVYGADGAETTLTAPDLSVIIPVALIMRPFKNGVGASKCDVGANPKLNPDFVISYFDLYQGANECINIGLSTDNIYSTVAILD